MVEQTPSNAATVYKTPLGTHGLDPSGSVHWNLTGEELRELAVQRGEATRTAHGALLATTGNRTGRSPNDRFIVDEPGLASEVHWSEVNRPISEAVFEDLLQTIQGHLNSSATLFVKDMHCGADKSHSMPVRLVSESAWHSAFMHNMFVRSDRDSLFGHVPEFTILHAPSLTVDPKEYGVNSVCLRRYLPFEGASSDRWNSVCRGNKEVDFYHYESHPTCTRTSSDALFCQYNEQIVCPVFRSFRNREDHTLSRIQEGHWSVMMSMVGQTKAYSILREVVMRR